MPLPAVIDSLDNIDASHHDLYTESQTGQFVLDSEDAKARLALQAPCAMTVGAKNRVLSEDEKRNVEALCGGFAERPVTVEELRRFLATPR